MLLVECGFKFNTQDGMCEMHFIVSGGSFSWMPLPTLSSYIRTNMLSQMGLCRWSKVLHALLQCWHFSCFFLRVILAVSIWLGEIKGEKG